MTADELLRSLEGYTYAATIASDFAIAHARNVAKVEAAMEDAYRTGLTSNAEVRPPPGHVLLPDGRCVRVLGELPMTADGCVIGRNARLWLDLPDVTAYCGEVFCDPIVWQADGPSACVEPNQCYSTREAALAARSDKA